MSADSEPTVGAIIFSLMNGTVWASWPGKSSSVELGPWDAVTYMMQDFLAQCQIAEQLTQLSVAVG